MDLLQSFLLTEELASNPRLIPPVLQIDETDKSGPNLPLTK